MSEPADQERLETLRGIPLFSELSEDSLVRLAGIVTEFEAPAGHVLIQAGQEASGMFVLEEGTVAVEIPGKSFECGPGELFGELALLAPDIVRTARVRATTPARCLAIGRRDFEKLLEEEPRVAVGMLPVLARRVADADAS